MATGINIQNDESNLTRISFVPLASHPTASSSHTQIYYKSGSGAGWYILPPSGSPIQLAEADNIPLPSAFSKTSYPTTADNVAAGYPIGSIWAKTDSDLAYLYVSGVSTANWVYISQNPDVHYGTVDPTTSDDYDVGFRAGQFWYNSSSNVLWVCLNPALGAAIWQKVAKRLDINLYSAIPGNTEDAGDGFETFSFWQNTGNGDIFINANPSAGVAVWKLIGGPHISTDSFTNPPTATELSSAFPVTVYNPGYQVHINNGGTDTFFYLCTWDGANWTVITATLAV